MQWKRHSKEKLSQEVGEARNADNGVNIYRNIKKDSNRHILIYKYICLHLFYLYLLLSIASLKKNVSNYKICVICKITVFFNSII